MRRTGLSAIAADIVSEYCADAYPDDEKPSLALPS